MLNHYNKKETNWSHVSKSDSTETQNCFDKNQIKNLIQNFEGFCLKPKKSSEISNSNFPNELKASPVDVKFC